MLFINYHINATRDEVMSVIRDNNLVVSEEKYDTSRGKPKIHIKERGEKIKLSCEMTERSTKDNGFLEGTYFRGSVSERDGVTYIKGIILTAPIYHTIILALTILFIVQCFHLGGISLTPIFLLLFSILMFKDEFRKQGIIKRYIFRALKITFSRKNPQQKRRKPEEQ